MNLEIDIIFHLSFRDYMIPSAVLPRTGTELKPGTR